MLDTQRLPASQPATPPASASGLWSFFADRLPTILVLGLLGGIAYWGHHTGWSIPKASDFFGSGTSDKDDWCAEHGVPETICVECNEKLMPRIKDYGWCRKHGIPNCPWEHPEVAQVQSTPRITDDDLQRSQRALDLKPRPENNSKCKLHHRRVQIASATVLDKMGIEVMPVWEGPIVETINASGEITFEQPRVAPLYTPVAGRVFAITDLGRIGSTVRKGDVIALVDAAEVGKAKTELLQALAQLDQRQKTTERMKPLVPNTVSEGQYREAEAATREAHIRVLGAQQSLVNLGFPVRLNETSPQSLDDMAAKLRFLGLPEEMVRNFDPLTTTANLLAIRSPRDGIVMAAKVVPGEMVDPAKTLFVVADPSQMWLILNLRVEDVKYARARDSKTGQPGQKAIFRPDGTDEDITGELVWINQTVDEKTRTVQVRADLPNPRGKLLANTFGNGRIVLREEPKALVVPNDAIHWEGDCHIAFVRDKNFLASEGPKVFHVRTIRPGVKNGGTTEIIAGLLPGEIVASQNSSALRAELLKNRLGAG